MKRRLRNIAIAGAIGLGAWTAVSTFHRNNDTDAKRLAQLDSVAKQVDALFNEPPFVASKEKAYREDWLEHPLVWTQNGVGRAYATTIPKPTVLNQLRSLKGVEWRPLMRCSFRHVRIDGHLPTSDNGLGSIAVVAYERKSIPDLPENRLLKYRTALGDRPDAYIVTVFLTSPAIKGLDGPSYTTRSIVSGPQKNGCDGKSVCSVEPLAATQNTDSVTADSPFSCLPPRLGVEFGLTD